MCDRPSVNFPFEFNSLTIMIFDGGEFGHRVIRSIFGNSLQNGGIFRVVGKEERIFENVITQIPESTSARGNAGAVTNDRRGEWRGGRGGVRGGEVR